MSFSSKLQKVSLAINDLYINKSTAFIAVVAVGLVLHTQGYCVDGKTGDGVLTSIVSAAFDPWVRTTVLMIAGISGAFRAWAAGSPKPFLLFGLIGLIYNRLPAIVDFLIRQT